MSAACLMLALVTLAAGAEGVIMAGRRYNDMNVWWKGAMGRLIFDDGALLYTKYPQRKFYILKGGVDEMVEGLPRSISDLLLDSNGTVWVANYHGLHHYSRQTKMVTKFSDTPINKLTAAPNGTIYGLAFNSRIRFVARVEDLDIALPLIRAYCIAISKTGDVYYTLGGLKRVRGVAKVEGAEEAEGAEEEVEGAKEVEGSGHPLWTAEWARADNITGPIWWGTRYLEVDPIFDNLYICHDDGLYFVRPGTDNAVKVPTIEGPVLGLGFTPRGDIFLGKEDKVVKLTLMS